MRNPFHILNRIIHSTTHLQQNKTKTACHRKQSFSYSSWPPSNASSIDDSDFSIVLLHDVTLDREAPWSKEALDSTTWSPKANVLSYDYMDDIKSMTKVPDLLDDSILLGIAYSFLEWLDYNLRISNEILDGNTQNRLQRPMVILAHGYGGLIYEAALDISYRRSKELHPNPCHTALAHQYQLAFLFDTPHFAAGLGEWAIMCARNRGLTGVKSAKEYPWTSDTEKSVERISKMQRAIPRHIQAESDSIPIVKIAGCFATLPDTRTKLMLSPDWALMPEFNAIPIHEEHRDMARLSRNNSHFRRIFDIYYAWLSDVGLESQC
ncbi:hypothetical protein PG984_005208 [Apiospora sp. TS-2023a]